MSRLLYRAILSILCLNVNRGIVLADTKPEPLQRAEQARAISAVRTAIIEWTLLDVDPDDPRPARIQFYTWKAADRDLISVHHGDEEGVVFRDPSGRPANFTYTGPVHALLKNGDVWEHVQDSTGATVWEPNFRDNFNLYDFRRIGQNPNFYDEDLDDLLRKHGRPPLKYSASSDGALVLVTGTSEKSTFKWWIDPAKDWSVERTAVVSDGETIGERKYNCEKQDGVWFPRRIEHYRGSASAEPWRIIEVLSAEFNRPDHPHEFTPADIGVECGTYVHYRQSGRSGGHWDGEKVITTEEFSGRLHSGELRRGPTVVRELQRRGALPMPTPDTNALDENPLAFEHVVTTQPVSRVRLRRARRHESEWEAYTRRFIERFEMKTDQTEKAIAILRDCEEQGRKYLDSRAGEFERLEARARTAAAAASQPAASESAAIEKELRGLRAPVDAIFEQQLKPRLDKLPTRAQREAAASRTPTSNPTRPDPAR